LRPRTFTAIDINESGQAVVDEFTAAHASAAARRAQFAAEGVILQLWTEGRLVGAWRRVGRRSFQPA
jgi:muconolactone delta-isomerase